MKRVFLGLILAWLMAGCAGYVPVAKYAKVLIPGPVYVGVKLSGAEPQDGVYIKDEINKLVLNRFHSQITQKKELSASQIFVTSYKIKYSPASYDSDGFVIRYKASTTLNLKLYTSKGILKKKVSGTEEINTEPSSLLNTSAKESAIRASIQKALDEFVNYIAKEGMKE